MKGLLIETLETLGYPVALQGTMQPDEPYPDDFITVLTVGSNDAAHYDNEAHAAAWEFQVFFYSTDPLKVASVPKEIRQLLKAAGFIPQGRGRDIPSDEPTHTGCAMDFYYLEYDQ